MINCRRRFIYVASAICCLSVSLTSYAEDLSPTKTTSTPFMLPYGSVPTEIFGNDCVTRDGDANFSPSLVCAAADPAKHPSISVTVADSRCEKTQEQMIAEERNKFDDGTPFFNVVWERDFSPLKVEGAIGFKAFYQKSMGNRYFWSVCGQGKKTSVLVVMFSPTDNEALKAEIENKVFGIDLPRSDASKDVNQ